MTKGEFDLIMRQLLATYPTFSIKTQDEQLVWWAKLKDLRNDYARLAVKKYTSEEHFAPVPADILTRYEDIAEHNRGLMNELRDLFKLARDYYPVNLWADDDYSVYMAKIKSQTFEECRQKANKIVWATRDCREWDKPFRDFIKEVQW